MDRHGFIDHCTTGAVLPGTRSKPLCAVQLDDNLKIDTLTACGTLGGELFDDFFRKYDARRSLDVGSRARNAVTGEAVVRELEEFCRNPVQCRRATASRAGRGPA